MTQKKLKPMNTAAVLWGQGKGGLLSFVSLPMPIRLYHLMGGDGGGGAGDGGAVGNHWFNLSKCAVLSNFFSFPTARV